MRKFFNKNLLGKVVKLPVFIGLLFVATLGLTYHTVTDIIETRDYEARRHHDAISTYEARRHHDAISTYEARMHYSIMAMKDAENGVADEIKNFLIDIDSFFGIFVEETELSTDFRTANDPETSSSTLRVLAGVSNWLVRRSVANHPNTSPGVLLCLAEDKDPIVKAFAIYNPNMPYCVSGKQEVVDSFTVSYSHYIMGSHSFKNCSIAHNQFVGSAFAALQGSDLSPNEVRVRLPNYLATCELEVPQYRAFLAGKGS